jgi:acyl carrier protein
MAIGATDIVSDLREISDQLDIDLTEVEISDASSLENDLGMDSLNVMDLLLFLEKKYQVKVADGELNGVATISDIVKVLNGAGN